MARPQAMSPLLSYGGGCGIQATTTFLSNRGSSAFEFPNKQLTRPASSTNLSAAMALPSFVKSESKSRLEEVVKAATIQRPFSNGCSNQSTTIASSTSAASALPEGEGVVEKYFPSVVSSKLLSFPLVASALIKLLFLESIVQSASIQSDSLTSTPPVQYPVKDSQQESHSDPSHSTKTASRISSIERRRALLGFSPVQWNPRFSQSAPSSPKGFCKC